MFLRCCAYSTASLKWSKANLQGTRESGAFLVHQECYKGPTTGLRTWYMLNTDLALNQPFCFISCGPYYAWTKLKLTHFIPEWNGVWCYDISELRKPLFRKLQLLLLVLIHCLWQMFWMEICPLYFCLLSSSSMLNSGFMVSYCLCSFRNGVSNHVLILVSIFSTTPKVFGKVALLTCMHWEG